MNYVFLNLQEVSLVREMLALEPIDNWIIKTQAWNHKTSVHSNELLDEITNAKCDTHEEEQNLSMYISSCGNSEERELRSVSTGC